MSKLFLILSFVLSFSGCTSVPLAPTQAVFVATLQSETMRPRWPGVGLCGETFSHAGHEIPRSSDSDMNDICISNSCGWSEVRLKVSNLLIGDGAQRQVVLRSSLGEWCKPSMFGQYFRNPVLVVTGAMDNSTESPRYAVYPLLETDTGELVFAPLDGLPNYETGLSAIKIGSLIKPIKPIAYKPKSETADLDSQFICDDGDNLVYCKAILLRDLKEALRKPR